MNQNPRNQDPANTGTKGTGDFTNDANDTNDVRDRDVAQEPLATPRSVGDVLEDHSVDLDQPEALAGERGRDAGRTDIPDPVDHTGSEWENGPGVDVDDPNLSQVAAEAGAEDRKSELGRLDEGGDPDEMRLDDPDQADEEGEGEENRGGRPRR